jgi:AcrR family transcriptional regulator
VRDSQRERIVDAIASIVAERGLSALTVPEIARRANVSHQTFYAIYRSKHDAFVGAQKVGMHQALQVSGEAWQTRMPDWPAAIVAGIRALTEYLVAEPAHARLTIVDTFGASPEAIQVRERMLAAFAAYFDAQHRGVQPGGPDQSPVRILSRPHPIVVEAVLGGCWQVLHDYVEADRTDELPGLAPQLAYLVLIPFIGPEAAASAVSEQPAQVPA